MDDIRSGLVAASVAAALGWAVVSPPAWAQNCDASADQMTLNKCADLDFRAADAELNEHYRAVMKRLADSPDAKNLLMVAQRAWIEFRNGECAFVASSVEGGSIYPMIASGCLAEMTRRRSADLKHYLECEEGDPSCPIP